MNQPIHQQLRQLRRAHHHLNQQHLANLMNVHRSSISNWERGHKSPSIPDAHTWAHTLHHRIVITVHGAVIGDLIALLLKLPTLRTEKGISQSQMAAGMWVARTTISGIERRIRAGDDVRLATVESYVIGLDWGVQLVPAAALERAA